MVSLPRLIMVILLPIMKNVIFTLILSAMALMPVHADNKPSKLSAQALYAQFQNPDSRYRPFVRWWWNGDAVVGKELVRELHLLRDAGIGGVEINRCPTVPTSTATSSSPGSASPGLRPSIPR